MILSMKFKFHIFVIFFVKANEEEGARKKRKMDALQGVSCFYHLIFAEE